MSRIDNIIPGFGAPYRFCGTQTILETWGARSTAKSYVTTNASATAFASAIVTFKRVLQALVV